MSEHSQETAGSISIDVRIAHNIESVPVDSSTWQRVLTRSHTRTIFQTRAWFESWWKIFGKPDELFFVTVFRGDEIIGFAPLMFRRARGGGKALCFAADTHSDYLDIIADRDYHKTVLQHILKRCSIETPLALLMLRNIPSDSPTAHLISKLARRFGLQTLISGVSLCPSIQIRHDLAYAKKRANAYSLKRPVSYFKRKGDLEVIDIPSVEMAREHLPRFFDQHIQRWHLKHKSSLFVNDQNRQFFQSLAEKLLPAGYLLFSVALLDNNPISYHFGFLFCGRLIWYKPSFDPSYAKHSPGVVLLKHLIDYAIDHNLDELDFTIGDEKFKRRYANHERKTYNFSLYPRGLRYATHLFLVKALAARRNARKFVSRLKENRQGVAEP